LIRDGQESSLAVMAKATALHLRALLFSFRRSIMAATSFATGDALAVKLWSKKIAVEALKATWA